MFLNRDRCLEESEYFKEYLELSRALKKYNIHVTYTTRSSLMFAVVNMRAVYEYIDYIDEINGEIENNSHAKNYYYERNGYYTEIPTSIMDLVNEAIEQDAILAKYALEIAVGEIDIVYVRKRGNLAPYISLEIRNSVITKANKKDCLFLSFEDYGFLERFAEEKKIHYDPRIILRAEGYDYTEDTYLEDEEPEMFIYLDGFRAKYGELSEF